MHVTKTTILNLIQVLKHLTVLSLLQDALKKLSQESLMQVLSFIHGEHFRGILKSV